MRGRLILIIMLRSPMKTLVTFLLLLATSFAFVSRGAEYAATVAEINKAEAAYSAVGTLQRSTEGYYAYMENLVGSNLESNAYIDRQSNAVAPIESDVAKLVLSSDYLSKSEFFMVSGGLTSEYLRNVTEQPLTDVPNYSEWDWFYTDGTFEMDTALLIVKNGEIVDVLIGDEPGLYRDGQRISITDDVTASHHGYGQISRDANSDVLQMENGREYLVLVTIGNGRERSIAKEVVQYVDYPVIDLTKLENEYGVTNFVEIFENPEKYDLIEYRNHFLLPTESTLKYVETLYRNFHTVELAHVSGMEALHRFHSSELYISDGRAITSDDTSNVCVVSVDYAKQNELKIGDTIEFEMSADTMAHSGKVWSREPPYPAITSTFENYNLTMELSNIASEQSLTERGLDTVTQTYEIVGIWSDSNYDVADPFSYSPNTVFVPASTYPWAGEVEPTMLPSTFSFTLNHPGDMAKIEAELGDQLTALGYELSINDMGYAEAKPSFEFMKLSALIGFVAMSAALLLSLILTVYLYIIRKKHDYAIMRALGTTRARSNRSLLVGLFALAIPAVFLGSLLALALTQGFAADLSAQIAEITGNATASSMPAWLVGAFGAGVLALLYVFARIGLIKISRTPPLALLQGGKEI